jgi:AcrR family transcriptional regulator
MSTRDRIFEAARRLFDAQGIAGVSLRNVGKEVGVTAMAIYRHFEDKDALVDALVMDGLAAWEARVRAISAPTPAGLLEAMNEAFLDFALSEPRRFEAAFMLSARSARRYPDDFEKGLSPPGKILVGRIQAALDTGLLAGASALEIWITLWGMSQGLISLYRAGRFAGGEGEFRVLYRKAMKRCVRSFKPEISR